MECLCFGGRFWCVREGYVCQFELGILRIGGLGLWYADGCGRWGLSQFTRFCVIDYGGYVAVLFVLLGCSWDGSGRGAVSGL